MRRGAKMRTEPTNTNPTSKLEAAPKAPTAPTALAPPPPSLQTAWFARHRGRTIRVHFADGSELTGVLRSWDTYTVAVALPGEDEPVLVQKHAVAWFAHVADDSVFGTSTEHEHG